MNLIHHSKITISDKRQRREFDELKHQEMIASLQKPAGLLQAIVLRPHGETLTLVAGERRLRAMKEIWDLGGSFRHSGDIIPAEMAPYVLLQELDPLDAAEAEYEENIRRVDLSWQERAEAEKALYELRVQIATKRGTPFPSMASLSEESRGSSTPATQSSLMKSLVLADNLHRPEVRTAKTATEAFKTLRRSEETERNAELAQRLGKEFLAEKHHLYNLDALEWLENTTEDSFDVILTDPIYGMGADEFGDSGGGAAGAHFYLDTYEEWQRHMGIFVPASYAITKPDAHAYVFCDHGRFEELKQRMEGVGWKVFRTPFIWYKPSAFRAPWPEQGPQRKYECILYAIKGNLKCTTLMGDVIVCPPDENLGHHAQKPVALYRDLLARSVRPGFRVLDSFCGTGPIFPAAHSLSAIAVGVEMDPAAFGISATRLQRLKEGK